MKTSNEFDQIAAALQGVQKDVQDPSRTGENPHYGSKYVTLEGLIHTVRPVLNEYGITLLQAPGMEDGCVTVETRLLHESGQWIASTARSPLQRDDPQGVGSAITYLRRYSLAAMLGVVSDEDDDGERAVRRAPPAQEFSPDSKVGFGKHSDLTWRELVEEDKGYAEWALDNADRLSDEAKSWLQGALVESDMDEQAPDLPDEDKSRQQARSRYLAECAKHFEEPEDAREFAAFLIRYYAHERPDVPLDGKLWRAEHFEAAAKWLAEQGEDGVADVLSWQMDTESEEPELFEGQGA